MTGRPAEKTRGARAVGIAGVWLLRALGSTLQVREVGREHEQSLLAARRPLLYAFWHGQLLPMAYLMRGRGIVVLVSEHKDGEYITQVIHRLGYGTVRGSSTRGGFRSLVEMSRLGRAGQVIAITPDGPRGPRRRAQVGALLVAQRGRVPIVPLACACSSARQLKTWDRFVIPRPFAKAAIGFGPPLVVPPELKPKALAAEWVPRVEEAINATCAACEQAVSEWVDQGHGARCRPVS
jgi:lysophospholipid acyltransferase (LPLAT)-like uncharacterized protein